MEKNSGCELEMDFQGHFTMREWSFRVEGVTAPGEIMCVVGSCSELGEWNPERVVPMKILTCADNTESSNSLWSLTGNKPPHPLPPFSNDGFLSSCETNRSSS